MIVIHSTAQHSTAQRLWAEFSLSQVFNIIKRGKRLIKDQHITGTIPYISSSACNNGVDNFISNSHNVRNFKNCITLANSGSVGSTFFHPYPFIASDHVTALELQNKNSYVYLFLATLIQQTKAKYSFNREINDKRIQREKILLPITPNHEPDWAYMEHSMKLIEIRKILKIIQYYNQSNLIKHGIV